LNSILRPLELLTKYANKMSLSVGDTPTPKRKHWRVVADQSETTADHNDEGFIRNSALGIFSTPETEADSSEDEETESDEEMEADEEFSDMSDVSDEDGDQGDDDDADSDNDDVDMQVVIRPDFDLGDGDGEQDNGLDDDDDEDDDEDDDDSQEGEGDDDPDDWEMDDMMDDEDIDEAIEDDDDEDDQDDDGGDELHIDDGMMVDAAENDDDEEHGEDEDEDEEGIDQDEDALAGEDEGYDISAPWATLSTDGDNEEGLMLPPMGMGAGLGRLGGGARRMRRMPQMGNRRQAHDFEMVPEGFEIQVTDSALNPAVILDDWNGDPLAGIGSRNQGIGRETISADHIGNHPLLSRAAMNNTPATSSATATIEIMQRNGTQRYDINDWQTFDSLLAGNALQVLEQIINRTTGRGAIVRF
jgi:hypothetical protein